MIKKKNNLALTFFIVLVCVVVRQGCIELLDRYGVQIEGKRAVVLGRSNIVGIPVSMLLMHRDATVTMVHSKTVDAASVVRESNLSILFVFCLS